MENIEQIDNSRDELLDGIAGRSSGGYNQSRSGGGFGASSPRSRRGKRTGKGQQLNTVCGPNQYYVEGFQRSGFTRNFLGQPKQFRGSFVRSHCRNVPQYNPWWDEVSRVARQERVSAAEAAVLASRARGGARSPRSRRGRQNGGQFGRQF